MINRNPQSSQMTDESMVRTLAAQVRCIWPQERSLFKRYGHPQYIIDVGCGTGEFIICLAELYPLATIIGIEIEPTNVLRAQERCRLYSDRVQILQGDAFDLKIPRGRADLVICRHLLQSIPYPELVIEQCQLALKSGGWLHLLLEDYTKLHFEGPVKFDQFWLNGPVRFGLDTNCDLRIGRRGLSLLAGFALRKMDYIIVDTERVSRTDFAAVISAWRDGYSHILSPYLGCSEDETIATMNEMIEVILNGYALWQVPIASGQKH